MTVPRNIQLGVLHHSYAVDVQGMLLERILFPSLYKYIMVGIDIKAVTCFILHKDNRML